MLPSSPKQSSQFLNINTMLDQIAQLVKEFGKDTVVENQAIPNEENNAILAEATKTVSSGLQNILAGGGLQNILDMFTGGNGQQNNGGSGIAGLLKNPIVSMMIGHFISKLTTKFNMAPAQASSVANNIIPNVLESLVNRTTSQAPENDSFDLNDLIGSLTGGKVATSENAGNNGFNFQGLLDQFTNANGGNGINIQDLISQVTQGAVEEKGQPANNAGGIGGITDLIKGFFK